MNATSAALLCIPLLVTGLAAQSTIHGTNRPKVSSRKPVDVSVEGLVQTGETVPGSSIALAPPAPPKGPPFACVESIGDQVTSACLTASSTPTLGTLFPYPGHNNVITGDKAFVGGGYGNSASGVVATIGGGDHNQATGSDSVIGGGVRNTVSGFAASVGGGWSNSASDSYNAVGGGRGNTTTGRSATVGGGWYNSASYRYASVGGGRQNTASGQSSSVGGGWYNSASGSIATVGGGLRNTASGQSATVGGGLRNTAHGSAATIAGGASNTVGDAYFLAGDYCTIGGGNYNTIVGRAATVGGGQVNYARGAYAVIGGGRGNSTYNFHATVGGGYFNAALGFSAAVPGGHSNAALGNYSFAAGHRAKANHQGAFVWGDGVNGDKTSSAPDQFNVYASGGVRMFTNSAATTGVLLAAGGSTWTMVSDRNAKENVEPVDARAVLDQVAQLPLATWNYKAQDDSIRHMGPMAQDFYAAFGLGLGDKTIDTIDPNGVALAAIQGLNAVMKDETADLKERLAERDTEIAQLRVANEDLRSRVEQLEALARAALAR